MLGQRALRAVFLIVFSADYTKAGGLAGILRFYTKRVRLSHLLKR